MPLPAAIRDVYLQPGPMTALGRHAAAVAPLPGDVAGVCDAVQGLVLHQFWAQAYGTDVGPNRAEQQHIRGAADMLDALIDNRPGPLGERREPGDRFVGVCRHFSVLSTAILRAHGVPARCRVGFGAYFDPKTRVDHWVVEHWDDGQDRWVLTDSQIDALQKAALIRWRPRATASSSPATPGGSAAPAATIPCATASSTCMGCGSSPATCCATSPA